MVKKSKHDDDGLHCIEVELDEELKLGAAYQAIETFPPNAPPTGDPDNRKPDRLVFLTQKFWGARANELTVGFMEQTNQAMRDKVLAYANRWGEFAKVRFMWTQTSPIIRVSFGRGGYWSYLGTDNLSIPAGKQTMNLEGFTVRSPDSEWNRVVLHEFGHALGAPHEHARKEIIDLLDAEKVISYFMRTQGWSREDVIQQILVPLEERSVMGSPRADVTSIMTYQFPASVTKSGRAIPGGYDFSLVDREYAAKAYPKEEQPPQPPQPPVGGEVATVLLLDRDGKEIARFKK